MKCYISWQRYSKKDTKMFHRTKQRQNEQKLEWGVTYVRASVKIILSQIQQK